MWYRFTSTHRGVLLVVVLCAALAASPHVAFPVQAQAAQADVSVTIQDSPDPVTAGQVVAYAMTVHNAGPDTAAAVKISYSLAGDATFTVISASASQGYCDAPADTPECHLGDLASGGTATIQVMAQAHSAGTLLLRRRVFHRDPRCRFQQ